MSVLLVTDDADDDVRNHSITSHQGYLYKQLKELEYNLSSSVVSFSFAESSPSIIVASSKHYRQHHRRRRARPQPCWVQQLLTYMITVLILTNQLPWSVIFLSLSSIKIMSTHASTTITPAFANQRTSATTTTATKRPLSIPSTSRSNEQKCLPRDGSEINHLCSRACRARKSPIEELDNLEQLSLDSNYLPFCSSLVHQKLVEKDFFSTTTEQECRRRLKQLRQYDAEAKDATESFAGYMRAIDCASDENRYSIINADCQKAYSIWACSVRIPFFHQNQRILPCQTICDEVERVCPTFRPSDREPLFAGQPLFFCNGGIVANSDYGYRPHCFDSCHLLHGSLKRPSASPSSSLSNNSSSPISPLAQFVEDNVTTPPCFEIEPLPSSSSSSSSDPLTSTSIFANESIFMNRNNASLSASARTILAPPWSSIILTFIVGFLQRCS